MKSKDRLGFILLDNWIIIDYVVNRTYILTVSRTQQIKVDCLLQSKMNVFIGYDGQLFKVWDTTCIIPILH